VGIRVNEKGYYMQKDLSLTELKIQAKRLLKALSSKDENTILVTIKRLQVIKPFKDKAISEISKKRSEIRLKDCLNLIACENGFSSWALIKRKYDLIEKRRNIEGFKLYSCGSSVFLNQWFSN
jgi:hypothetical protein